MRNCDNNEFLEQIALPDNCCEFHRFIDGYEDEKNYMFYDDSYFVPGYLIVTKKNDEIIKFLKIYVINSNGFPTYGVRAFSIYGRDNPDCEFNSIEFIFSDKEDNKNGLFDIFTNFCKNIDGKIETSDTFCHGRNNICLSTNGEVTKFIISKDIYGVKNSTDFIDVNIGDNYTCKNYDAIVNFYKDLSLLCLDKIIDDDVKKILKLKLK